MRRLCLLPALLVLAAPALAHSPARPVSHKRHPPHMEDCSRCTGASPCRACSSCEYCAYCNSGGSCGVCASSKHKSVQRVSVSHSHKRVSHVRSKLITSVGTQNFDKLLQDMSRASIQDADLAGLSQAEIVRLRNTPYARHGYRFHDANLRAFFSKFSWYHADTSSQQQAEASFSNYEKANITTIVKHDQQVTGD